MQNNVLQQAECAIATKLREAGHPLETHMVLEVIAEETSIDEFDLRDAVWRLIGRGLITLTRDRKLSTVIAE